MQKTFIRFFSVATFVMWFTQSCTQNTMRFNETVTYQMLQVDSKLYGNNKAEIKLCEELISKAIKKINRKYSHLKIANANPQQAIDILGIIDSTFTEFDFLFYTDENDVHYNALTLAMREEFEPVIFKNEYQRNYWKNKKNKKCKRIDCDQYCRIYLGIGQMLNMPISIVHIPNHYYLRWHFPDSTYFSWNPNDATVHIDERTMESFYNVEKYQKSYTTNYFPKQLNVNEVLANYQLIWADNIWDKSPRISVTEARKIYLQVIESEYTIPSLYNNYVWLYVMNPELDEFYDSSILMEYINKAIEMQKDVNYFDAKACLLGLQGNFEDAILTAKMGLQCNYDFSNKRSKAENHLKCFIEKKVCRTIKE